MRKFLLCFFDLLKPFGQPDEVLTKNIIDPSTEN